MRNFCLTLFILVSLTSMAQDFTKDMTMLLVQNNNDNSLIDSNKKKRNLNPLSLLYRGTLGFYQKQISPQWGANCAFELTCSRFSGAMVKEYGLTKGFFLTLDRMGRCNKLSMYETLPLRITPQGKIIDEVAFYHLRE